MSEAAKTPTGHSPTDGTSVRVAVIIGSIREDRFGPVPARWVAEHARARAGLEVDLIDLHEFNVPTALGGNDAEAPTPASVRELGARVAAADALVVVTPVYNRSYPGSLKNAIDWLYGEWQLKPVGLVAYGGVTGGLQAVESLRGVLAEFDTVVLRDTMIFANCFEQFDHDGLPVDLEGVRALADTFFDQLTWWAHTLSEGRARRPYPADRIG